MLKKYSSLKAKIFFSAKEAPKKGLLRTVQPLRTKGSFDLSKVYAGQVNKKPRPNFSGKHLFKKK